MSTYGVGMYGCGFIGQVHTYCYKNLPFYFDPPAMIPELKGVCTSSLDTAKQAKEKLGFDFATTDYRKLLNNDDIQIVNCCTPNHLHKDFVIEAIKAGKHIYCEKPLAKNYTQAREILDQAQKENFSQKLQITHNYRFLPATIRAKQLIEEGFLGQVFGFRAQYLHSSYIDRERPMSWRLDKEKAGSGALGDLGTHVIDLMYHLLGPFSRVMADQETFIQERYEQESKGDSGPGKKVPVQVDDITTGLVRLENGAMGTIEAWRLATGSEDELRFEIHGSKGALKFNLMEPNWLAVYDNQKSDQPYGGQKGWQKISTIQKYPEPAAFPSPKVSIGWMRSHVEALHSFLQAIKEDKQTAPSLEDGVYVMKIHDAFISSARKGEWVGL
ncbi:MAG: Gfo/Idh/MocA family protein [bacterium]